MHARGTILVNIGLGILWQIAYKTLVKANLSPQKQFARFHEPASLPMLSAVFRKFNYCECCDVFEVSVCIFLGG